jgi:hypothetical protein
MGCSILLLSADSLQGLVAPVSTEHKNIHRDNVDKSRPKTKPEDQAKAFRKAARQLGADESEERFKETLRTLAKAKPQPQTKKSRS